MTNHNYSDPTTVTSHEAAIRDLISQLPAEQRQFELVQLKASLELHGAVALDCREAHLDALKARLEIIVSR